MNVKARRRRNLLELIEQRFGGNRAAFARAIDRPAPNVHRMLTEGEGDKRGIGEDLARSIEGKLGLEPLTLDREEGGGRESGEVEGTTGSTQPQTIGDLVRLISPSVNPHTERLIERLLQLDRAGALPSELSDSLVNLLQACLMTSSQAIKAGDYSKLMDAFNDRKSAE